MPERMIRTIDCKAFLQRAERETGMLLLLVAGLGGFHLVTHPAWLNWQCNGCQSTSAQKGLLLQGWVGPTTWMDNLRHRLFGEWMPIT